MSHTNRHDVGASEANSVSGAAAPSLNRQHHGQPEDRHARAAGGRPKRWRRRSPYATPRALLLLGVVAALFVAGAPAARASGDCSPIGFESARYFTTGVVKFLASADFDGDGRPDIAALEVSGNTVVVLLNDGEGWLGAPARYAVGDAPAAVAAADLNGDGRADLAVVNRGSGTVSVLLSGAGGVFGPATDFAVTETPNTVLVDDFNADGKADIAAGGAKVSVLLGDGAGAFSAGAGSDLTNARVGAAADFNSDGRRDLVVTGSQGVTVLAGDGAGGFLSAPLFSSGDGGMGVAGDLNGDGKTDLALNSGAGIVILLGDGAGGFSAPLDFNGIGRRLDVRGAGDLDGDGKQDLVTRGPLGEIITLKSDGAGGFSRLSPENYFAGNDASAIVLGDFDGDGRQDVAAGGQSFYLHAQSALSLLMNKGGGELSAAARASIPYYASELEFGEFNGDGIADAVMLHPFPTVRPYRPNPHVTFLLGGGAGEFTHTFTSNTPDSNTRGLATGDFNKDGRGDVAVGLSLPSGNFVSVHLSNGDGTFAAPRNVTVPSIVTEFLVGDFNGDANPDIFGVTLYALSNFMLLGDGGGGFTLLTGTTPGAIGYAVGDFNGDGTDDLAHGELNRVLISLSKGGGQFEEPRPFAVPGFVWALVVGDFNHDGKRDVAAATQQVSAGNRFMDKGAVTALLGDGAGGLATARTYPLDAPPDNIVAADFDGDGDTDLAVGVPKLIFVLAGDGSGAFGAAVHAAPMANSSLLAAHDFNADGRADLATGPGTVVILLGESPRQQPCLSTADATEGTGEGRTAQVTVTLSEASAQTVKVNYTVVPDETHPAHWDDFTPTTGSLTFRPGETSKTITILAADDASHEYDESFKVLLFSPLNARIRDGVSKVTIVDDDPPPALSIQDVTVVEGDPSSNYHYVYFTLAFSAPAARGVEVSYVTTDGTATAGSDYEFSRGSYTIGGPTGRWTISVRVRGDLKVESDETFSLTISRGDGGVIADGQAVATITDDDASVRFGADALAVNEGDGSFGLEVTRAGNLARASAVNYAAGGGAASRRSDYDRASGTLHFAPGEASKTITVFVTDDALIEDPESFDVTLSDPEGCEIISPSVVSVTINSDDASAAPNPADATSFFVRQHYRDFLGRDPDPEGMAFWADGIESCGAEPLCREVKRVNVSAAFFLSIEFQETGYLVYRMYKAAYGDATSPNVPGAVPVVRLDEFQPDAQRVGRGVVVGPTDWRRQLEENKNAFALEFVGRQRFLSAFPPSMTGEEFVTKLDLNAGNVLTEAEKAQLVSGMASVPMHAERRAAVLRQVAENARLRERELNRAFVLMQYFGYLRRNPDESPDADFRGWRFWLDKLEQFQGDFERAEMVKAFLSSLEYRQRFGQ